jgi:hypothetical protein
LSGATSFQRFPCGLDVRADFGIKHVQKWNGSGERGRPSLPESLGIITVQRGDILEGGETDKLDALTKR